jgi:hypothetical protein
VPSRWFTALALAVAIGLATGLSPFGSASPDGLERVAERHGFGGQARLHRVQKIAPAPDYAAPGIGDPRLATGLAGFAGTLGIFVAGVGLAARVRRRGAPG